MDQDYNIKTFAQKKESGKSFYLNELTEIERFCTAYNLLGILDAVISEGACPELQGNELTKKLDSVLKSMGIHIYSLRHIDWKNKKRYCSQAIKAENKLLKKYKGKNYPVGIMYAVPYSQFCIRS